MALAEVKRYIEVRAEAKRRIPLKGLILALLSYREVSSVELDGICVIIRFHDALSEKAFSTFQKKVAHCVAFLK